MKITQKIKEIKQETEIKIQNTQDSILIKRTKIRHKIANIEATAQDKLYHSVADVKEAKAALQQSIKDKADSAFISLKKLSRRL